MLLPHCRVRCRFPWDTVSVANWLKYPNTHTPHVLHVDYLQRYVDPATGDLHTERLITCRQGAPAFLLRLAGEQATSHVLERSVVQRAARTLVLRSTNVTLAHLLTVEETCRYEPARDPAAPDGPECTRFTQHARITSLAGWQSWREYVEDFGTGRFQENARKGRLALEQVIHDLAADTRRLLASKFGEHTEPEHCPSHQ